MGRIAARRFTLSERLDLAEAAVQRPIGERRILGRERPQGRAEAMANMQIFTFAMFKLQWIMVDADR